MRLASRGPDAHPAGAVDLLRGRVAALRTGGEMLGLHSCLAGGCRDAASAPAPSSLRTPPWRVFRKLDRRGKCKRRERCRTGDEIRYACSPGSLAASTIVSFARQIGYAQATRELEAAANVRRLAVSYIDRALLSQAGPRFPVPAERELRTLAEALDALMSRQIMTAMDIIGQRFRAIEASILEDGGWSVARHLEFPKPERG